ncbi:MAG: homocysteine S-methyltransferase family protein [Candidatus Latescibacterota bacterium]
MNSNHELLRRFRDSRVLFDGGIGSMLIAAGLKTGAPPEEWNRSHPDKITRMHQSYVSAGAHIIETNTFGATPARLASFGLGGEVVALNQAAVQLAREAAAMREPSSGGATRWVAFSIGPTGKMLPPVGNATEEEIRNEFTVQIESVKDSVDLFLIETIFDVREGLCALQAAKDLTDSPVAVTMTFNKNPRGFFTMMGDEANASLKRLETAGADIVGANCTIASAEMVELAPVLRDASSLLLLCQPNAGSPTVKNGMPLYEQSPESFADDAMRLYERGIQAVGGCCGTTPDFIREVASRM